MTTLHQTESAGSQRGLPVPSIGGLPPDLVSWTGGRKKVNKWGGKLVNNVCFMKGSHKKDNPGSGIFFPLTVFSAGLLLGFRQLVAVKIR